jgi:hypothetical protein
MLRPLTPACPRLAHAFQRVHVISPAPALLLLKEQCQAARHTYNASDDGIDVGPGLRWEGRPTLVACRGQEVHRPTGVRRL